MDAATDHDSSLTDGNGASSEPFQFSLRGVFATIWVLCALLGAIRVHWIAVPMVGIPAALIGCTLLTRRPLFPGDSWRGWRLGARISLILVPVLLSFWICANHGRPGNEFAWLLLVGATLWVVHFALVLSMRGAELGTLTIGLMLAMYVPPMSFHSPFRRELMLDPRGGRRAYSFGGSLFICSEQNTELLEKYVGPLEPEWRVFDRRSGGCNRLGLIADPQFREVLGVLPNDEAKRQVIRCLTDPTNRFRVHQGLLLAAVYVYGYPRQPVKDGHYDSETWWDEHEALFRTGLDVLATVEASELWLRRLDPKVRANHVGGVKDQLQQSRLARTCLGDR